MITLKAVVLPAPLGPIRDTISPLVDLQVHIVHGYHAAKLHGDIFHMQDVFDSFGSCLLPYLLFPALELRWQEISRIFYRQFLIAHDTLTEEQYHDT